MKEPFPMNTLPHDLIEESARWRMISMLLECPSEAWRSTLKALASEISDPSLREAANSAQNEASEGLYHSLFGPGGHASPREVSYHRSVELGRLMSEVTAYYEAFDYHPASAEACDHIAVEAGFIGYLRLKEAYALACGSSEQAEITADAAQSFINVHLSSIALPLGEILSDTGVGYLALAGQALIQNATQHRNDAPGHATDQANL